MHFTVIVPVFNRPDELAELLDSLCMQHSRPFDVLVVDDGSDPPCEAAARAFAERLDLAYVYQENAGPGAARNHGAALARGDYVIFFDSDCMVPPSYMDAVQDALRSHPLDAFGGPDRAHPSFTAFQRAVSYAMTSFLTTGGIRGGKKKLDTFYPKTYNMGVAREAWAATTGFPPIHPGEDIDLSLQLERQGFRLGYIPDAFVYHKRRTDLWRFFKQVYKFGLARVTLHRRQPGSFKPVHALPALFVAYVFAGLIALAFGQPWPVALLMVPAVLFFGESLVRNRSLAVALLSVGTSFTQLVGYGLGVLVGAWRQIVLGKDTELVTGERLYR